MQPGFDAESTLARLPTLGKKRSPGDDESVAGLEHAGLFLRRDLREAGRQRVEQTING